MNKKIIFYFLTALIVLIFKTDSSYSTPIFSRDNGGVNIDPELLEKIKSAMPLTTISTGGRAGTIRNTTDLSNSTKSMPPFARKYDIINNTIVSLADTDQVQSYPIGLLILTDANGDISTCTASVIDTEDGNIAVTAAHCLFDFENQVFRQASFCPGFDNGQLGPLGPVPVVQMEIPDEFRNNNDDHYDYGMMRFNFQLDGHPLQYYTGSLGWRFDAGNNVPTTIRGYPNEGNLPNCANDGDNLCTWNGQTTLANDYYVIPDLEIGNGASGAPFIMLYDPGTNLGYLYSNYGSFDELEEEALAPIYDPLEFVGLIAELEHH